MRGKNGWRRMVEREEWSGKIDWKELRGRNRGGRMKREEWKVKN